MSTSRYITLNGITSTLLINESEGQINWTLNLADAKDNHASANGSYTIKNVTKTDKVDNTTQHVSRIREMLESIEASPSRSDKVIYACILFNYILKDALDFVKKHEKFSKVLTDKCYEMKAEASESVPLVTLINKLLTALSAPLEKPVVVPVKPEVKPEVKSEEKTEAKAVDDVILQGAIKSYERYYPNRNWSDAGQGTKDFYIGLTKRNEEDRAELMKSILKKKGLTFNENTMIAYHTWEKTYKPAKPANRFQKMSEFAKTLSAK